MRIAKLFVETLKVARSYPQLYFCLVIAQLVLFVLAAYIFVSAHDSLAKGFEQMQMLENSAGANIDPTKNIPNIVQLYEIIKSSIHQFILRIIILFTITEPILWLFIHYTFRKNQEKISKRDLLFVILCSLFCGAILYLLFYLFLKNALFSSLAAENLANWFYGLIIMVLLLLLLYFLAIGVGEKVILKISKIVTLKKLSYTILGMIVCLLFLAAGVGLLLLALQKNSFVVIATVALALIVVFSRILWVALLRGIYETDHS